MDQWWVTWMATQCSVNSWTSLFAQSINTVSSEISICSFRLLTFSLHFTVPNSLCSPRTDHTENTSVLLLWPLYYNGRCLQSRHLTAGLHATIYFVLYMFTISTVSLTPKTKPWTYLLLENNMLLVWKKPLKSHTSCLICVTAICLMKSQFT